MVILFVFLQVHAVGSLLRLQTALRDIVPIHPQISCLSQHIQFLKTRNGADLSSSPLVWEKKISEREIYFINTFHSSLPIVARFRNSEVIQQLLVSLPK